MKEKLAAYSVQFLIVGGACLAALWAYDYLKRPKIAPPATTTTA